MGFRVKTYLGLNFISAIYWGKGFNFPEPGLDINVLRWGFHEVMSGSQGGWATNAKQMGAWYPSPHSPSVPVVPAAGFLQNHHQFLKLYLLSAPLCPPSPLPSLEHLSFCPVSWEFGLVSSSSTLLFIQVLVVECCCPYSSSYSAPPLSVVRTKKTQKEAKRCLVQNSSPPWFVDILPQYYEETGAKSDYFSKTHPKTENCGNSHRKPSLWMNTSHSSQIINIQTLEIY